MTLTKGHLLKTKSRVSNVRTIGPLIQSSGGKTGVGYRNAIPCAADLSSLGEDIGLQCFVQLG